MSIPLLTLLGHPENNPVSGSRDATILDDNLRRLPRNGQNSHGYGCTSPSLGNLVNLDGSDIALRQNQSIQQQQQPPTRPQLQLSLQERQILAQREVSLQQREERLRHYQGLSLEEYRNRVHASRRWNHNLHPEPSLPALPEEAILRGGTPLEELRRRPIESYRERSLPLPPPLLSRAFDRSSRQHSSVNLGRRPSRARRMSNWMSRVFGRRSSFSASRQRYPGRSTGVFRAPANSVPHSQSSNRVREQGLDLNEYTNLSEIADFSTRVLHAQGPTSGNDAPNEWDPFSRRRRQMARPNRPLSRSSSSEEEEIQNERRTSLNQFDRYERAESVSTAFRNNRPYTPQHIGEEGFADMTSRPQVLPTVTNQWGDRQMDNVGFSGPQHQHLNNSTRRLFSAAEAYSRREFINFQHRAPLTDSSPSSSEDGISNFPNDRRIDTHMLYEFLSPRRMYDWFGGAFEHWRYNDLSMVWAEVVKREVFSFAVRRVRVVCMYEAEMAALARLEEIHKLHGRGSTTTNCSRSSLRSEEPGASPSLFSVFKSQSVSVKQPPLSQPSKLPEQNIAALFPPDFDSAESLSSFSSNTDDMGNLGMKSGEDSTGSVVVVFDDVVSVLSPIIPRLRLSLCEKSLLIYLHSRVNDDMDEEECDNTFGGLVDGQTPVLRVAYSEKEAEDVRKRCGKLTEESMPSIDYYVDMDNGKENVSKVAEDEMDIDEEEEDEDSMDDSNGEEEEFYTAFALPAVNMEMARNQRPSFSTILEDQEDLEFSLKNALREEVRRLLSVVSNARKVRSLFRVELLLPWEDLIPGSRSMLQKLNRHVALYVLGKGGAIEFIRNSNLLSKDLPMEGDIEIHGMGTVSSKSIEVCARKILLEKPSDSSLFEYVIPDECPICMDPYQPTNHVTILPCSHMFHTKCVTTWATSANSSCPTCRYDLQQFVEW